MLEFSKFRFGSVNIFVIFVYLVESGVLKFFNLFFLIVKVKDNMSLVIFFEFVDEVFLIVEEEDISKEDLNESSENNLKVESENVEYNLDSSEIVDDFFFVDFLKVFLKRLVKLFFREV